MTIRWGLHDVTDMLVILFLFLLQATSVQSYATTNPDGFLVFLTTKGVSIAEGNGQDIHYGDENFHLPEQRQGCAVDHNDQILFFTSPDEDMTPLGIRWNLWKFIFVADPNTPIKPEKVASIKTSKQDIRGVAVDSHGHNVYVSFEQAGSSPAMRILKLEDYDVLGRTISRQDAQFTDGLDITPGEGGQLVIILHSIYVIYRDSAGAVVVSEASMDNPAGGWKTVLSISGVIPAGEMIGDMVGSDHDEKLYISTNSGTWLGKMYIVDLQTGAPAVVLEDRVQEFGTLSRPAITMLGKSKPNEYATIDPVKSYSLWVCEFTGVCDKTKQQVRAPPTYGLGPVCFSEAIREKTPAPPTQTPTDAPATPEPSLMATVVPTTVPGETLAPGNTLSPISTAPIEETVVPFTAVPDAVCGTFTVRDRCVSVRGCEFVSDAMSEQLGDTVDTDDTTNAHYRGKCVPWGSLCPGKSEAHCAILSACFYDAASGTCLVSSDCPNREGQTKCNEDAMQCKWDVANHRCIENVTLPEPEDDNTMMLLFIALGATACVYITACCLFFFCIKRVEKVADEFDGNKKRKKWYQEARDEQAEEQQREKDAEIALVEFDKKAPEESPRVKMINAHLLKLNEFDCSEPRLNHDDIFTPPPDEPDTDSNGSDVHHDAPFPPSALHDNQNHHHNHGNDLEDGPLAPPGFEPLPATEKEIALLQQIHQKRSDIDIAAAKSMKSIPKSEDKLKENLMGDEEGSVRGGGRGAPASKRGSRSFGRNGSQSPASTNGSRRVTGTGRSFGADPVAEWCQDVVSADLPDSVSSQGAFSGHSKRGRESPMSPAFSAISSTRHQSSKLCSDLSKDGLASSAHFNV